MSIWCDDFPSSGTPISGEAFSTIAETSLSEGTAKSAVVEFTIDNLEISCSDFDY